MNIPFVDLKAQYLSIKKDIDFAIENVLSETAFIGGIYVKKFEQKFSELCGVKHCISVANGTDSLYIILKMLGIKNNDEVLTSAYSWISSSETISQTGAKPIFIDIDNFYYTINEDVIESKISPNTKAIIPVHIHGQVCNMDRILSIAKKYNLYVIEDCAQSHFSEYKGKLAGTMGIASSFSFYPGKNLGAYGDAGCILTNDDNLAELFRMYANHGALIKHSHKIEGINSRLDGIQASILSAKLPYIHNWTEKRISCAEKYTELLKSVKEIVCPAIRPETKHSFHLYVIRTSQRDELKAYLKRNGIETAIHYPSSLPNLDCYKHNTQNEFFPIATRNESQILSLPIYPELSTSSIIYITDKIKEFFRSC